MSVLYNLWWVYLGISIGITTFLYKWIMKVKGECRNKQLSLFILGFIFYSFAFFTITNIIPEHSSEMNILFDIVNLIYIAWFACHIMIYRNNLAEAEEENNQKRMILKQADKNYYILTKLCFSLWLAINFLIIATTSFYMIF